MDLTVCAGCYKRIEGTFVRAFGQAWHDICFKCGKCRYPIRDTKYASDNNTPYHGDCLALLRGEVCNKCSKPITGTVTTALGKKWHPDCFLCGSCGLPILTSQFSARDGVSFHIHCQLPTELPSNLPQEVRNSNVYAPASPIPTPEAVDPVGLDVDVCHGCYQVIRGGITTTALGKTWHPECFKCGKCGSPVRENKFKTEGLVPYHINCKLADSIRICRGCYQVIEGTEITEAMDELWHPECFKCHNCGLRIHGREFTREGIHPIHLHCKRNDLNTTEDITSKRSSQLSPNSTSSYYPARATSPVRSTSPVRGFSPTQNMTSPPTRKLRDDNYTTCKRCGQVATGTVCFALGATFHPECFTCGNCGLPIMDQEFLNGAMPFHKNCINNLVPATNTIKLV